MDTVWIPELIHSQDIQISQRFALWYPASWLVTGFTEFVLQWSGSSFNGTECFECFFWLGGKGSNPRCREVERCCRTRQSAKRNSLSVHHPPAFLNIFLLGTCKKIQQLPFNCFCFQMLVFWLVRTNKWWSKHGIVHLWVMNTYLKKQHVSPSKLLHRF